MMIKWKIGGITRLGLLFVLLGLGCYGGYGQGTYRGKHYRTNVVTMTVTNIEVHECLNRLYYGIDTNGTVQLLGTAYDHDEEMMENGLRSHQRKFLLILRSDVPIRNPAVLFQPETRTPVDALAVPPVPNPTVRPGMRPIPPPPPLPSPRPRTSVVSSNIVPPSATLGVVQAQYIYFPYAVPYAFECQGGRSNGVFVRTNIALHYFAESNRCYVTFTATNMSAHNLDWSEFIVGSYCSGPGTNLPAQSNTVNIPILGNGKAFYSLRSN